MGRERDKRLLEENNISVTCGAIGVWHMGRMARARLRLSCEASLFVRGFAFRARLRFFHRAPYLAEFLKTARYLAAEQFEGLGLGADRRVELGPVEDRRTRLGGDGEEVAHDRRAAAELSRLDEGRLRLEFWKNVAEVGARQFGRDRTVIFGFLGVFFRIKLGGREGRRGVNRAGGGVASGSARDLPAEKKCTR